MIVFNRRRALQALLGGTSLLAAPTWVRAQDRYPAKPVTLLVPQPAGGDADAFSRLLQPRMQELLGQPLIIDNRGGAAGNIGTALGARAAADGYTVTFVNQGAMTINPHLYANPGFTVDQFVPVSHLASVDLVVCASPALQAGSLRTVLELARKAPGALNYATAGNGSANHLAAELLQSQAKVSLTHIPYRGGAPAITAALGGEVQLVVAFPLAALQHIKAGTLKALAVTGPRRSSALPDVPTVAESGLPGYEFSSWFGLMLPRGTPEAIVTRVHDAAVAALKTPSTAERLSAGMTRPVGSSPRELSDLITRESSRWGGLIRQLGIKLD